ncbi:putative glycosyltransferase family 20 protein [Zalerion maritima]|uniref:Glycosyltransferase family 20 protein n=1 Tax=Zalerion maritima TaxID=339359 RepID=A0AAD5RS78_9PEZI|nr:putative glycosyltransferase family 20 protein [Zalerion maritima]
MAAMSSSMGEAISPGLNNPPGGIGNPELGNGFPLDNSEDVPPSRHSGPVKTKFLEEMMSENPSLALTGNVISANFNIPYSLKYRLGADWELKPRRGQSALFDSFSYLSSDKTSWSHRVVAWTGEIEAPSTPISPPITPPSTTVHLSSLNSLSAPVPLDKESRLPSPPLTEGVHIPRADQERLEYQLSHTTGIKILPVWLADDTENTEIELILKDQARWRRYAENELYTMLHYKQHDPNDGRAERTQWADYYRMNQLFANKILEVYKPGDIVVVHDYFLMLLPSMLRQKAPHMYIAFFLHSPFPSSEFLRCLPRRKEVLEGMLGSNLIGFQSYGYSRHFSSCCTRILGFPSDPRGVDAYGARVEVASVAIGIDAKKAERFAFSESVNDKYAALKKMYEGKKVIVGRDRLDSVRGVAQKLQAFQRFLERYPEWNERVVLVQVTSPTNIEDPKGGENTTSTRVNELVLKINGMYGSLGFSPVLHYPQYLTEDEYFALLRAGDIGLITSVRDGMNTTSLEYVVCQKDSYGPLILSEFSGTAGSLTDAIRINPWDSTGVADQINRALVMSEGERKAMQESLYSHVKSHDVRYWIDHLLHRIMDVLAQSKNKVATPLLDRSLMLRRYTTAKKRLFMFDYDGTLTPIVREPAAAVPSARVIEGIKALANDHRNAVWIISGRDQEFLKQNLGHISELGFSAEHGSFMRHPGELEWEDLTATLDMSWREKVNDVFQKYTDRIPGSFVERKKCAITWHYRLADPELGPHMAEECKKELEGTVAKQWDVEVMPGKANLEVRPTFISKGEIAKRLVASYNKDMSQIPGSPVAGTGENQVDSGSIIEFIMCAGDDTTDEDMFRALNNVGCADVDPGHIFTVTVGASTKPTLARWHILEPEDVIECIALLGDSAFEGGKRPRMERLGSVNFGALSAVVGHIPEQ